MSSNVQLPASGSAARRSIEDLRQESGATVTPFPARGVSEDLRSPVRQLNLTRRLSREVVGHLPAGEYALYHVCFDRSIGYGNEHFLTTYEQLQHGCKGHAGLGKSHRQLQRHLRSLEKKGALTLISTGRGLKITINLDWSPNSEIAFEPASTAPKTDRVRTTERTKRESEYVPVQSDAPKMSTQTGQNCLVEEDGEVTGRQGKAAPPSMNLSHRPIAAVAAKTALASRSTIARRPAQQSMTASAIAKTWADAFHETYADVPGAVHVTPTRKDLGMLKATLVEKWSKSPEELHAFVRFVVTDWMYIRGRAFSWMKKEPAPEVANFDFFLRFHDRMLPHWSTDRQNDWLSSISDYERRLYLRLTRGEGKTHEEALAEVGRNRALSEIKDEMHTAKQEAARVFNVGMKALKDAERMGKPVYGVHNPHPQSAAARGLLPEKRPTKRDYNAEETLNPSALTFDVNNLPTWKD